MVSSTNGVKAMVVSSRTSAELSQMSRNSVYSGIPRCATINRSRG